MNKQEIEKMLDGLKRMRIAMFNYCIDGERIKPFLDTAISALERQIPMKPSFIDSEIFECSNCRWKRSISNIHFCPTCGQAIDWRNEDE